MVQMVKSLPVMQDTWVQSLGQEDPLEKEMATQYSCLENPMDGGAWWATVHGVAKTRTRLREITFTFFSFPSYLNSSHDFLGFATKIPK